MTYELKSQKFGTKLQFALVSETKLIAFAMYKDDEDDAEVVALNEQQLYDLIGSLLTIQAKLKSIK